MWLMRGGGGGEEHSYSHTVRGITHTHMCCCQVAACAVAWMLAMHQHLVWRTQWHTPPCHHPHHVWMHVRSSVPRCCCDVYCHREGREEERQLGHDAMTRVVVVAAGCEHHVACWHQQTIQHSKGKGGGRGGAATRTACERDTPSSPQPPAQTSSHQP